MPITCSYKIVDTGDFERQLMESFSKKIDRALTLEIDTNGLSFEEKIKLLKWWEAATTKVKEPAYKKQILERWFSQKNQFGSGGLAGMMEREVKSLFLMEVAKDHEQGTIYLNRITRRGGV